jgi:hypothetical protein
LRTAISRAGVVERLLELCDRVLDGFGGRPFRRFPTYTRGSGTIPVVTATTGCLIGYESRLERDRLWLADFHMSVSWIASQPFWVSSREGETLPGGRLDASAMQIAAPT